MFPQVLELCNELILKRPNLTDALPSRRRELLANTRLADYPLRMRENEIHALRLEDHAVLTNPATESKLVLETSGLVVAVDDADERRPRVISFERLEANDISPFQLADKVYATT